MVISNRVAINNYTIARDGISLQAPPASEILSPEKVYTLLQCSYPKFYKMDKLCKWAIVAAEYLFAGTTLHQGIDKSKIAVVLTTAHGCIDVDKRYLDGISVPSPALFVYTLPNIMLGEICIRHGFKGEQLCMVTESFDAKELYFAAQGLLNRGMEACLCGWVDTITDTCDIHLFWITKNGPGTLFATSTLQQLYASAQKM